MTRSAARIVAALGALTLAACGVPVDSRVQVEDDADVPGGLLAPSPPEGTVPAGAASRPVTICLLGRDGRLVEVNREAPEGAGTDQVLAVLTAPLGEPERALGLSTGVASTLDLGGVEVVGGVATVSLTDAFADRSSKEQLDAVAQIVCTLTAQPGVGQVHFELGGVNVEVPRGDGSSTSDPVSRGDYPNRSPR